MCARAKSSEAKTNLGAIYTVQHDYHARNRTYASGPDAFALLNWAPEGQNMYAYYCGDDMIANTKGGDTITLRPGGEWPYPVIPAATATGFTCVAVGNLDYDPFLDVWTISETLKLTNPMCDLNDNGRDIGWVPPLVLLILIGFGLLLGLGAAAGIVREAAKGIVP